MRIKTFLGFLFVFTADVMSDPNIVKVHFSISLFLEVRRCIVVFLDVGLSYWGWLKDRTTGLAVASGVGVASAARRKRKVNSWEENEQFTIIRSF
jgi:hypothetical protein